jgi:uncharacterized protein
MLWEKMVRKKSSVLSLLNVLFMFLTIAGRGYCQPHDYPISMLNINSVEITDNFWLPRIRTIQNITISSGFAKCSLEGRMDNFLIAGRKKSGTVRGHMPFDDTDLYKIIEGASYSLVSAPNDQLNAYLDSIIAIIGDGQETDGYLTTWFTIDPHAPPASWVEITGKRWTGESSSHELYNSGHLFEAAVAHYYATGKHNFLDIAIRNADLLVKSFGPGLCTYPPGHQIVETGLVKLYRVTRNEKYLRLAKYFLDLRGDSTAHKLYGEYNQDHLPVTRQTEIVGHAVRAVYMYAGMTDIGVMVDDQAYLNAVKNIWTNMVERKMYLTGGIGAKHEGESLGKDYELPNLTSYSETCASIGDVYWNNRLFLLSGDAKYFDLIERTLYNGLNAGLSLDGKNFFYVNPLESDGNFKFNQGTQTRQPWFDCSCCPTNIIRFIPSLPGLVYAVQKDTVYVNLYASNKAKIPVDNHNVSFEQHTDYPWQGNISIVITPEKSEQFTLKLRIPGWAQNQVIPGDLYSYTDTMGVQPAIVVCGRRVDYRVSRGYAMVTRLWNSGDTVSLSLPMGIRHVRANGKVHDDWNMTALECGPIVYCVEGIDNDDRLGNITLPEDAILILEKRNDMLGGVNVISGMVPEKGGAKVRKLTAIPYYAWSNRGIGTMKVWLPKN